MPIVRNHFFFILAAQLFILIVLFYLFLHLVQNPVYSMVTGVRAGRRVGQIGYSFCVKQNVCGHIEEVHEAV